MDEEEKKDIEVYQEKIGKALVNIQSELINDLIVEALTTEEEKSPVIIVFLEKYAKNNGIEL